MSYLDRPTPPQISNAPASILDAWTALEVLSPQTFQRPEELVPGDRQAVALLGEGKLPWQGAGEKSRPKKKLFYQIILGTVDFAAAIERLLAVYSDSREERPTARGEAILAAVTIRQDGRLVERPAAVSSFAWGLPRALRGDLASLANWREEEDEIAEDLAEIFGCSREEEEEPLLDREMIEKGYRWLLARLDLPQDLVKPPRFAVRRYVSFTSPDPPEPLLLTSFFLNDLAKAKAMFVEGKATANLRLYVGEDLPRGQKDLLRDHEAVEAAVAPGATPPACWPGKGRHPLVLLQQAAVNLALQELQAGGILGVNGPPGTGKTTLLRDVVAANVTARAEAMASFEDPSAALIHSGEKLNLGQAWLHLYRLDPRLKGFEMLVASSNNKAVENVSAELPGLNAIAGDAQDLRFFKTTSDTLLERETWGLIAAVLGNAANRGRFSNTFWWDKDVGLSTYLAEAAGTPQRVEVVDPETGARQTRPPRIVTEERPPRSQEEALRRWQKARAEFQAALAKSREMLEAAERIRALAASLPELARRESETIREAETLRSAAARSRAEVEAARALSEEAQTRLRQAQARLSEHDRVAPGLFARLFGTSAGRAWRVARAPLAGEHVKSQREADLVQQQASGKETALAEALGSSTEGDRRRTAAADRHAAARREVEAWREASEGRFIDRELWERDDEDRQKTTPWLNAEQQRLRQDVFVAAMALHRAFIAAAAKPLRHNLGVLMSLLGGRALPTPEKRALTPDLWSSLFLVVPLVSTTFASVERMFRSLPPESLGWLFVDEAGQAVPQAAVGALLRTRRAVIVGDPMQIEPVVTLPNRLTQTICRQFGVDPDRFDAPAASVQTLADSASPFLAELESRTGSRRIGLPLLVHRRCSEPMFGISNAVAYEHLMVNAKRPGASPIGEILGASRWIDVRGNAEEKWCPEEGRKVVKLLGKLAFPYVSEALAAPDLYIVTPFVQVAMGLRKMIEESGLLAGWTDDPRGWVYERIGTVHTVQGREAEAVILVLGAPAPHQAGARGWAGSRPNLLNVAVTRAKERLYVVGNRELWRQAGLFRTLDERLPPSPSTDR